MDFWDNKPDTSELDALVESVDSDLHRKTFVIGNARAGLQGYAPCPYHYGRADSKAAQAHVSGQSLPVRSDKMLTAQQVENIQIDHGLIYVNYGETDERSNRPDEGGAQFVASAVIRDIEYDGRLGQD